MKAEPAETGGEHDRFALSSQQLTFFETFGFLRFRGLFAREIADISAGFDTVFADEGNPHVAISGPLEGGRPRTMIPDFVLRDPRLAFLPFDPRVVGILDSLFGGEPYEFVGSDGNHFFCDTSWHCDTYQSPLKRFTLRLSMYLEPLTATTGALRVIPGSHLYQSTFARLLREGLINPAKLEDNVGMPAAEIPSVAVETDPGDLLVFTARIFHATFGDGRLRRNFSMSWYQVAEDAPG